MAVSSTPSEVTSGTWTGEHSLEPVPDGARSSTAGHQFWIWAGANIAPINWVLGALGIALGLSLADVILVLVAGNLIGMALFGFFVLMGQRTGVTQRPEPTPGDSDEASRHQVAPAGPGAEPVGSAPQAGRR